MPASITIPKTFTPVPELIITGFSGAINYAVADRIRNRAKFSEFASWGVRGKIWWDERTKSWYAEIWKKTDYIATLAADIIEDLAFTIQKEYGWK